MTFDDKVFFERIGKCFQWLWNIKKPLYDELFVHEIVLTESFEHVHAKIHLVLLCFSLCCIFQFHALFLGLGIHCAFGISHVLIHGSFWRPIKGQYHWKLRSISIFLVPNSEISTRFSSFVIPLHFINLILSHGPKVLSTGFYDLSFMNDNHFLYDVVWYSLLQS